MKGTSYFLLSAAALLFTVASITSCNKDKTSPPIPVTPEQCPDSISFAGFVEPMIELNCSTSGCHDAASSSGAYNLEGHANISLHANDILEAINHVPTKVAMPYFQPKLSDSLIAKFECWNIQGAIDN